MNDYSKKLNIEPGNVNDLLYNIAKQQKPTAIHFFDPLITNSGEIIYSNNGENPLYLEEFKNIILDIKNSCNNKIYILSIVKPEYLQEDSFVEIGIDAMFDKDSDNYLEIFSYNVIPENPFEILKCRYLNMDYDNGIDIDKFYDDLSLYSPKRIIKINDSYKFTIKKFTDRIFIYGDYLSMRKISYKNNYYV